MLLPYPAPKTAHRATQVRVCFFSPERAYPSPFRGRGWVSPVLGLLEFSCREARCFSAGKDGYFVSEGFSRQLPVATAGHSWPNRGCLEVRWCVGPTHLLTSQKPPHRVEFGFAHQNELTPPPLGGRARYRLFGSLGFSRREARCFSAGKDGRFVSEGFSRQLPLATAAHNWVTLAQQGRSGPLLVSFPYPIPYQAPKTAHRAIQG